MANRVHYSSSCSLKAATAILHVVLILHVIGFALPKWVTVEFTINTGNSYSAQTETGYHAGLWQHCGCTNVLETSVCICFSRANDPAWFKMVQATETLGLIGLILSMTMSLTLMCYKQKNTYKKTNLLLVIGSGTLILIGVIVFGIKTKEGLDQLGSLSDVVEFKGGYGELSYAFILCTVAGCLCLVLCTTLFTKDMCTYIPEEAPVHLTAQAPPPPQDYIQDRYVPMPTQTQCGSPPAQYGSPPSYEQY